MSVPSKAYLVLLVQVQLEQRVAARSTSDLAFREVTN